MKNDFAILELCEEIHFHQAAQPICLPAQAGDEYDGVPGIISGWGAEDNDPIDPQQPKKLKEANMTTFPSSVCSTFIQGTMGAPPDTIDDSMICVRGDEQYLCFGDSGGIGEKISSPD